MELMKICKCMWLKVNCFRERVVFMTPGREINLKKVMAVMNTALQMEPGDAGPPERSILF